jgi:3-carboxy-cis,cis-muconate cycloisomerase
MSELFWPGDGRAGDLFTDRAFLAAMVRVESAWADADLDVPGIELAAEAGGNPVIPLVEALRAAHPDLGDRIHTGLTSQDVLDTALVLMLREAVLAVEALVRTQLARIAALAGELGSVPMMGRTLTQDAQPITFGAKLDTWRRGLADGIADLGHLTFPVQKGGPVGTDRRGLDVLAGRLGLEGSEPWHTSRRTVTRAGDALVALTDAFGRIARDVLELSRTGELTEGVGGGSSSMPHKHNPVLSVLVRRAALTTPMLAATLHLAAAEQVDERADGAWHAEWDTLRLLVRRTAVAASQTAQLLDDVQVHPDVMKARL